MLNKKNPKFYRYDDDDHHALAIYADKHYISN